MPFGARQLGSWTLLWWANVWCCGREIQSSSCPGDRGRSEEVKAVRGGLGWMTWLSPRSWWYLVLGCYLKTSSHTRHRWRRVVDRASLPHPCHYMTDEEAGPDRSCSCSQGLITHNPLNMISSTLLPRWDVEPTLQSAAASEWPDQFSLVLQLVRGKANSVHPHPLSLWWYQEPQTSTQTAAATWSWIQTWVQDHVSYPCVIHKVNPVTWPVIGINNEGEKKSCLGMDVAIPLCVQLSWGDSKSKDTLLHYWIILHREDT